MGKYSKINYDKLTELLEEFEFPYNDTLTEIFYRFSGNEPAPYSFYYKNDAGELTESSVYHVLSFNKHNDYVVQEVLENIVSPGDGEFYPFAVDDNGDYIGLFITDIGEELLQIYIADLDVRFEIVDERNMSLTLEDFLNGMR